MLKRSASCCRYGSSSICVPDRLPLQCNLYMDDDDISTDGNGSTKTNGFVEKQKV
jgi:hypothetical protein